MTRLPPVFADRAWTGLSLNDSPSFCKSNRSSSSDVLSSLFLLFSVMDSDSCKARS